MVSSTRGWVMGQLRWRALINVCFISGNVGNDNRLAPSRHPPVAVHADPPRAPTAALPHVLPSRPTVCPSRFAIFPSRRAGASRCARNCRYLGLPVLRPSPCNPFNEVFSLHGCLLPHTHCKRLQMLSKLMTPCAIMGACRRSTYRK